MKFATFIQVPTGDEKGLDGILETYLLEVRAAAPTLRGGVYRLSRPSPGTYFDALDAEIDPNFGGFDILIETWFSSADDFRREMLPLEALFERRGLRCASYHVTPRLYLDARIAESGSHGARPEITTVCAIRWKPGLDREDAVRRYDRHAAIALRTQIDITKYEQNIVEEVISWTDGVIPMDAYADFSHPTVEACRTGLRASKEERQDTSGYVALGRFSYLGDARPLPR